MPGAVYVTRVLGTFRGMTCELLWGGDFLSLGLCWSQTHTAKQTNTNMGGLITKALDALNFGQRERRVLMVGLDAAGKTTVLYKFKLGECINTIPTIGFNVETVQYKNINFTLWDVGGQDKIRPLWKHYYHNTDAVIFVVDSNDRDRVGVARDELHRLLSEDELSHSHLLVFANKQDLPNAMSAAELTEKLQLQQLRGRQWYIQGACATTGDGLCEGLDWMAKTMRQHDGASRGVRA